MPDPKGKVVPHQDDDRPYPNGDQPSENEDRKDGREERIPEDADVVENEREEKDERNK